jgi:hypothetical protein
MNLRAAPAGTAGCTTYHAMLPVPQNWKDIVASVKEIEANPAFVRNLICGRIAIRICLVSAHTARVTMSAIVLPDFTNGHTEVGIAAGSDDIDEPYAILRIGFMPATESVAKAMYDLCVAIAASYGDPNNAKQANKDVIMNALGYTQAIMSFSAGSEGSNPGTPNTAPGSPTSPGIRSSAPILQAAQGSQASQPVPTIDVHALSQSLANIITQAVASSAAPAPPVIPVSNPLPPPVAPALHPLLPLRGSSIPKIN